MTRKTRFRKDDTELTLLALPTSVWYILFSYLPMFGIIVAFKRFKPLPKTNSIISLLKSEFVGIDNFKFLFATPDAWIMFRNTLLYNAVFIILGVLIPVTLAILISQLRSKVMAKVYQTSIFLPYFLSWVVVSYFVFSFLSVDKGLANSILKLIGRDPVQWYMESKYWPYFLIFLNV